MTVLAPKKVNGPTIKLGTYKLDGNKFIDPDSTHKDQSVTYVISGDTMTWVMTEDKKSVTIVLSRIKIAKIDVPYPL